ncbi:MAG TPA: acetate--CoA ligase family protein [Syntrophales bacterium]|jgi:acetyl-CoA synthetase (ADP-forming)|nr:acetate--CoA ligase family protein [Syntrophales bacterium]HRT62132.1 acetate--CoA ligase family protein [Syntrophales bacterium]
MEVIERARKEGRKILTEHEAKVFLSAYDVPVVRERLILDREQLRDAVRDIGFPLVMKSCVPEISHKSERGLVVLDIRSMQEAETAFEKIVRDLTVGTPAVLVQEMVKGKRELVAGLTRDAQFGPTVMFGLGGIFTEILSDVVFRLAPFDRREALKMIGEIKGRKILEAVRGMDAVDVDILANILVAIGEIALEHPAISEIDINPLIISGRLPVAADALIVLV